MKELKEVLENIDAIVDTYEGGHFRALNEMHRELSSNMYWLVKHQIEYNQRWNAVYHNYKDPEANKTSSAAKERQADKEVPELYQCRKIWEAAKNVSIAIGYERQTD